MTNSKIVWINSYPKSGNTWMRMFLANYFYANEDDIGINDVYRFIKMDTDRNIVKDYCQSAGLPIISEEGEISLRLFHDTLRYHLGRSGNLFLKSHAPIHLVHNEAYFPKDLTACFVYVVRHPFDTLISDLNFNFGSKFFPDYTDLDVATESEANQRQIFGFMQNEAERLHGNHPGHFLGSWKNHVNSYLHAPYGRVKVVKYEDMLADPANTFMGVVRHIIGHCDEKKAEKAIAACQFKKLQSAEENSGFKERSTTNNLPFFRHGKSGEGKLQIPEKLQKEIKTLLSSEMKILGYE